MGFITSRMQMEWGWSESSTYFRKMLLNNVIKGIVFLVPKKLREEENWDV